MNHIMKTENNGQLKYSEEDIVSYSIKKLIDEGYEAGKAIRSGLMSLFVILPSSIIALHTVSIYSSSNTNSVILGIIGVLLVVYTLVSHLDTYIDWIGLRLIELESQIYDEKSNYFLREAVKEQKRNSPGYRFSSFLFNQHGYKSWAIYFQFFSFIIFLVVGEIIIFGIQFNSISVRSIFWVILLGIGWAITLWILPQIFLSLNTNEIKALKRNIKEQSEKGMSHK